MAFGNLCCVGSTPALRCAGIHLAEAGITVVDSPDWNTRHLLLDVPSFRPGGLTEETLDTLLASLPKDITIWGGNLDHPKFSTYHTVDLLQDETYLLENADITADCTIPIVAEELKQPWEEISALIIGWGRIGKALAKKLKNLGCTAAISSRSDDHRQEAEAQGFQTADLQSDLPRFHLIVNTAPAPILSIPDKLSAVKIDLASVKGLAGEDVIWAKGLPGRYAPQRSGKLIVDTILRRLKEDL